MPPAPTRWDNPEWLDATREMVKIMGAHRSAKKMEQLAFWIKPPITHEVFLPRVNSQGSSSRPYPWADGDQSDDDDEIEERMANYGFTYDEMNELLCQGVKPWDEDAWVCNASL